MTEKTLVNAGLPGPPGNPSHHPINQISEGSSEERGDGRVSRRGGGSRSKGAELQSLQDSLDGEPGETSSARRVSRVFER